MSGFSERCNGRRNLFVILVLSTICLISFSSCEISGDDTTTETQDDMNVSRSLVSPGGFTNISYSPDRLGCLKTNPSDKKFLHLEGTGYAMGFQHGYLLAPNVRRMASADFVIEVLSGFLGVTADEFRAKVGQTVTNQLMAAFQSKSMSLVPEIPAEYLDEIRGIVAGAAARGYAVSYENLLVINTAFDILLGVAYPIVAPILGLGLSVPHMCDGFIVNGRGTTDGRTLMGRNFMFTDRYFHDEMLLVEYWPGSGNRFVTPTIPGWVGLVTGMNVKGIGVGCDMAPAIAARLSRVGMGVVLTLRKTIQYSNTLSQGITNVLGSNLGISWIITVGSGINEIGGAVIETASNANRIRYLNYKYPLLYSLIEKFPKQIEDKPDLVVFANHFITPEMHILAVNPAIPDSRWRYETLTNLVLGSYGKIDTEKGKQLVDYLHPPAYNYYGTDSSAAVRGSRTVLDLKNLELSSLYGHYNDQWMVYRF